MGKYSKEKGKRGERLLAKKLNEHGYSCRRGVQYNGLEGEDVIGLSGIHIECKFVERLNIYEAMTQAATDRKKEDLPAVFQKRSNCDWLVTMKLDDWIELYREWEMSRK